mmetsp:Transcript_39065/g.84992  ORF Transcript_39065/g.84992 Transcript_39065/m.84992 type:complete len:159 (-) Transcript_39065:143-619(-)|eukprot:CAMPEP_0118933588 /NCGR_PEP_ID=MMETSP1169-20130426/12076_1 /TAXON_ID=36882 /ORGANISM="Pyramimonas obovata, Strain CCMP722" /LENGTH=158 /DNA_ID=CAMNT_0006876371 /DNA_START=177 /DNA_END=653 /DNA_ORIENTATION=-
MSHRRKHVLQEALSECRLPEPDESILRVLSLRGSNLVEAELPDGSVTLCRMPQKFNKMLWVKRGSFVVAKLGESDGKVNGEVYQVLYADHVKQFKKEPGVWPPEFDDAVPDETEEVNVEEEAGYTDESDDGLPPLEANTNHRRMVYNEDDESSDDDVI